MSKKATLHEVKAKLMGGTGDLTWTSEKMGKTEEEVDALRTYTQVHFGSETGVVKALMNGVAEAVKVVKASSIDDEMKKIIIEGIKEELTASAFKSLLNSAQNVGLFKVRAIPRKAVTQSASNVEVTEAADL